MHELEIIIKEATERTRLEMQTSTCVAHLCRLEIQRLKVMAKRYVTAAMKTS